MKKLFAVAGLALFVGAAAQAATVNLVYKGTSSMEPDVVVTGTGQFVTKTGFDTGAIGVDDLQSFNFSFSYAYRGKVDSFSFDLADLGCAGSPFITCGFDAVLTATDVASLTLRTDEQRAQFNWSQGLVVRSLGHAFTGNFDMPPLSTGSFTATLANDPAALPEPSSWALAGLALGAGLFASRRRAR